MESSIIPRSIVLLLFCFIVLAQSNAYAEDVLIVTMDKCQIKKAMSPDGKVFDALQGAYLLKSPPGPDHQHSGTSTPESSHDHSDYLTACDTGKVVAEGDVSTMDAGHTCCRYFGGEVICSHSFCPPH